MTNLSTEDSCKGYVYFPDGDIEEVLWFVFESDSKSGFKRIDFTTSTGFYIYMRFDYREDGRLKSKETWWRRNNYDDHGMPNYDEIDISRIELF